MSDIGNIYKITNKTEQKSYVGQTTFAILKRYNEHVKDSAKHEIGCRLLMAAIQKYGSDDFIIEELGNYSDNDLDHYEEYHIKEHNTLSPNGYNLTTGGKKGFKFCEETLKILQEENMGHRMKPKKRKYDDDADLPKYITIVRNTDKDPIGCLVNNFPIGVNTKNYISKKFMSIDLTIEHNILLAKRYLLDLHEQYKKDLQKIKNKRVAQEKQLVDYDFDITKMEFILPVELMEIHKDNILMGYKFVKDDSEFTKQQTLTDNLFDSLLYLNKYDLLIKNKTFVVPELPNGMLHFKDKNRVGTFLEGFRVRTGYKVNMNPNPKAKKNVPIYKKFCDMDKSLEEKYNAAKNFYDTLDIYKQHQHG